MKFFNFKFLFIIFFIIFIPVSVLYYYYYNYFAKVDVITLKANNSFEYKTKQPVRNKKQYDEKIIYKSRVNKFQENYFRVVDTIERPKKMSDIIEKNQISIDTQDHSIFSSSYKDQDSEIQVIFENNNNKRNVQTKLEKSLYYIELGAFSSNEEAKKIREEIQSSNKKFLEDLPFILQLVNYNDRAFVKLSIQSINSFNEARQICKIIKEFQNYCLIKNY
jgi:hypothetical protein